MDSVPTEKVTSDTLVNPFLTEKTRRMVCRALGVNPAQSSGRDIFLRKVTAGQLKERIPTYENFCERATGQGHITPATLEKARALYK